MEALAILRTSTNWRVDNNGRLKLVHGDSFIQWVEWNDIERRYMVESN